ADRSKGKKDGPDDSGGDGSAGAGGGGAPTNVVRRHRREVKKVVEHTPKELRILVNGFLLGAQRVNSEINELKLSVKGEEKIGFVEILSEQRMRLLFLNVDPPPGGEAERRARVNLSDGRTLDL